MASRTMFLTLALALASPAFGSPIPLPDGATPDPDLLVPVPIPKPVPVVPVVPVPVPVKPWPRNPWLEKDGVDIKVRQASAASPAASSTASSAASSADLSIASPMASAEAAVDLSTADFISNTENDLLNDATGCTDMMVIFARGTTEVGNVGTLVGPEFFKALAVEMGAANVGMQGVDYPADIPGFLAGGSPYGSKTMAALVQQAISQCPSSKIVMSGYSQGAQLVHNAAVALPDDVMSNVAGAILFGDPDYPQAVQGVSAANTMVICHPKDLICAGTATVLPAHLTYSENAGEAAKFAASL